MAFAQIIPSVNFPFLFTVEELYGTRYQSGSFSLINVGSGFHCLRKFFSSLFFLHLANFVCYMLDRFLLVYGSCWVGARNYDCIRLAKSLLLLRTDVGW